MNFSVLKKLPFIRNYTTSQWSKWWTKRQIDWTKDYLATWNHPHRYMISGILQSFSWMSLLEIGCGSGPNLMNFIKTMKDKPMQLGGCDINPDAIELAKKTFTNGMFKVCPGDDIMMSDKSADVILTDMMLIYAGPTKIKNYLRELRRITRNKVVLCEFHSENFWDRFWLRVKGGLNAYDYPKLLEELDFYDIMKYKIPDELWPDAKRNQKFRYIIVAKAPKR